MPRWPGGALSECVRMELFGTKRRPPILSPFVFHQRHARPVSYSTFRREFAAACTAAKVKDRATHDCRRTVARDLRRAGVPETVAMSITGHETAEIFRRYSIVDTRDQFEALRATDALAAAGSLGVGGRLPVAYVGAALAKSAAPIYAAMNPRALACSVATATSAR